MRKMSLIVSSVLAAMVSGQVLAADTEREKVKSDAATAVQSGAVQKG